MALETAAAAAVDHLSDVTADTRRQCSMAREICHLALHFLRDLIGEGHLLSKCDPLSGF